MGAPNTPDDAEVARLLGRPPAGAYRVVVRRVDTGSPVVIENAPLLTDGRPMPTRWWLLDPELSRAVGRLESEGGVRRAEAAIGLDSMEAAHRRYDAERSRSLPGGYSGPVPTGGVGGARRGGKCLHAHLAWWLAGGDDPTGLWTAHRLVEAGPVPSVARDGTDVAWPVRR